jgi:WD40 repeat protein
VIKWSINSSEQESSFDCGPEKPTAICMDCENIVTASKNIKVWNSESGLVQTFTGHSSNVFILSASRNDGNLSLWRVAEDTKKSGATATFTLLNNSPNSINF